MAKTSIATELLLGFLIIILLLSDPVLEDAESQELYNDQ